MISIIKNTFSKNLFYILPCLLWFVIGGFLLFTKTRSELFFPINQNYSDIKDHLYTALSAYGRADVIGIIFLSVLILPVFRNKNYLINTLLFAVIIPTIIFFTKLYFDQPRPILYYGLRKVHTIPWNENYYNNSFPSGHTLAAFGFFLMLSILLPKKQKAWSLLFFMLALGCGISRIYLGQHFFRDIYAGSIIGFTTSYLIYIFTEYLLQKYSKKND